MSGRQYPQVQFSEGGKVYTFHHDGEALSVGDRVDVPVGGSKSGRTRTVAIVSFAKEAPKDITTSAVIIRKDETPAPDQAA